LEGHNVGDLESADATYLKELTIYTPVQEWNLPADSVEMGWYPNSSLYSVEV
jgi:hypothetical protein